MKVGALLMKDINWKTVAELIGIAAIVASLYFLGQQLKLSHEIAVSEISASHHSSLVELNNGIADHADVWNRGNAGLDLDQAEVLIHRALLENVEEQYRIQWRHDRRFGRQESALDEHAKFAAFLFENSGARELWMKDKDEYYASRRLINPDLETHRFYDLVNDALKKYDEL
jgi:hypothetical protein